MTEVTLEEKHFDSILGSPDSKSHIVLVFRLVRQNLKCDAFTTARGPLNS